jgi:hypothetical protein
MTNVEAMSLSHFARTDTDETVANVVFEILKKGLHVKPTEISPKQLDILAMWAKISNLTECALRKNTARYTEITVLSLKTWPWLGTKPTLRGVPKMWGIKEAAAYVLTTGDFPTPGQSRKIASRSRATPSARTKTLERE